MKREFCSDDLQYKVNSKAKRAIYDLGEELLSNLCNLLFENIYKDKISKFQCIYDNEYEIYMISFSFIDFLLDYKNKKVYYSKYMKKELRKVKFTDDILEDDLRDEMKRMCGDE